MSNRSYVPGLTAACILASLAPLAAAAGRDPAATNGAAARAAYWTKERRAAAIPRDLRIDSRGLGYLRRPDGTLAPHGHTIAAVDAQGAAVPNAGPPGSGDTTPPTVGSLDPVAGATIGASYTFKATVTDTSGVRSVSFVIDNPSGGTQSFAASTAGGGVYTANLSGFTDGEWGWHVVAKDNAAKGGNTKTTSTTGFTVDTGGGGGGGGGTTVTSAEWTSGGAVQTAAGRIYFEMPANARKTKWNGYVCSGTVTNDSAGGRSIIITASHCVYDDANKAFARNVLFIPNQANTSGTATDLNCANDPVGCWAPTFGVVDVDWTSRVFPDNVRWDYAFYVVPDTGAHTAGLTAASDTLDAAVATLSPSFAAPKRDGATGSFTHALGYSYSDDPNFMYCAEGMETESADDWWLPSCELSGGSSGGPWVQPMTESTGSGPIISVNSWGYTTGPGMAGPVLSGTSASCVFNQARTVSLSSTGVIVNNTTCSQP